MSPYNAPTPSLPVARSGLTISRRQRGFRRGQLQHRRHGGRARGAANQPRRELDRHAGRSCTRRWTSEGSWGDDLNNVLAPARTRSRTSANEFTDDEWYQAGLTIEGSIGSFDVVYSGNYLDRDLDGASDYSDYSYCYDNLYTTGYFARLFLDNDGNRLNRTPPFIERRLLLEDEPRNAHHDGGGQARARPGRRFYQKQFHDFYQPFGP